MSRSDESWHEANKHARKIREHLHEVSFILEISYDPYTDNEIELSDEIANMLNPILSKVNELIGLTSPDWLLEEDTED